MGMLNQLHTYKRNDVSVRSADINVVHKRIRDTIWIQVLWGSWGNRTLDGKALEWWIWLQACCAILKGLNNNICCLRGKSGPQPAGRQMLLVMMKLAFGRLTIFWSSRTAGCWGSAELCDQCCLPFPCRIFASENVIRSRQKTLCGHLGLNTFVKALCSQLSQQRESTVCMSKWFGHLTCLNQKKSKMYKFFIELLLNAVGVKA